MPYFRPVSASIIAFALFVAWNWLSMSGVNYDGALRLSTFTTAGWFVLGFPFIAAIALAYAAFIAFLFRKRRWVLASLSLGIVVAMTGASAYASLPQTRVMAIVGSDIGSNVTVHRLLTMDSFNDGVSTFGVISGSDETLQIIAYKRQLKLNDNVPLHLLQRVFPDDGLPDYGAAYADGRSTFYFHSDTNCIYFARWQRRHLKPLAPAATTAAEPTNERAPE